MRHLVERGSYKPGGMSGRALIDNLMILRPEIYGTIADPERVELDGLHYVFLRLPRGIEECRFIKLISREGYEKSQFDPIVAPKRRRNSYRIDKDEMLVEMTRGRSDIYDILTHLTFLYSEANKIYKNSLDNKGKTRREWIQLGESLKRIERGEDFQQETAYSYLSTLLGRTFDEVVAACQNFNAEPEVNDLFHITWHLGELARQEDQENKDREIGFSSSLRDQTGHHYFGEVWAKNIKRFMLDYGLLKRPLHIISANLHSVMNALYGPAALKKEVGSGKIIDAAMLLSKPEGRKHRAKVEQMAKRNGMLEIDDESGTNIVVQLFDSAKFDQAKVSPELNFTQAENPEDAPVIIVMDYAFGEQAYESMDELLRPYHDPTSDEILDMNVHSINIMGKAGILEGKKGDIMVPDAHVFEGSADNYPFVNELKAADFKGQGLDIFEGPMITVMGTSLQNRDILDYFLTSSWRAAGLEMEGAHYQKAIQAATRIRKSANPKLKLRYAYYASDNPLITGHTLASGSLGVDGVLPTYLITQRVLQKIFA
ncbi:MAG: hypothetical protein AAF741_07420 [Bacteroidota bacterium]